MGKGGGGGGGDINQQFLSLVLLSFTVQHERGRVGVEIENSAVFITCPVKFHHTAREADCWLCMSVTLTEFVYLFIYLLKAYSPVNRTGSSQGMSLVQNLHKFNGSIIMLHIPPTKVLI